MVLNSSFTDIADRNFGRRDGKEPYIVEACYQLSDDRGSWSCNQEASSGLTASVIRTEKGLQDLADEWSELFDQSRCDNVYLSHEWILGCWSQRGLGAELFLVTVRSESGKLLGIAPFWIVPQARLGLRFNVLCVISAADACCDHLDLIVAPDFEDEVAAAMASQLRHHCRDWCWAEFDHVAVDSPAFRALARHLADADMTEYRKTQPACPYVALNTSYDEFLAGLSGSMRKNLRRYRRSLEGKGTVEVQCITEPSEIENSFAEFIRLHRLRFSEAHQTSAFLKDSLQKFHRQVLLPLAKRGWVRIYLLRVENVAISALYGFSTGRRFYHYQAGLDPAWLRDGAGATCIAGVMEDCIARGEIEYDFLRGEEEYKTYWTKSSRQDVAMLFFGRRLASQLEYRRLRLLDRIRTWKKPAPQRTQAQGRQDASGEK